MADVVHPPGTETEAQPGLVASWDHDLDVSIATDRLAEFLASEGLFGSARPPLVQASAPSEDEVQPSVPPLAGTEPGEPVPTPPVDVEAEPAEAAELPLADCAPAAVEVAAVDAAVVDPAPTDETTVDSTGVEANMAGTEAPEAKGRLTGRGSRSSRKAVRLGTRPLQAPPAETAPAETAPAPAPPAEPPPPPQQRGWWKRNT
jgi:pilus assembly protein FimV